MKQRESSHLPVELHDLFPLPTTSFERYMLGDDRDSHPMAAFMEIEVRGRVDADLLTHAYRSAVDRHPLLRADVRYNRLKLPYWRLTNPRTPDVAAWHEPLTCPEGERLDLTKGPGMRTWIRRSPERTRITIQVHHACSDALGKLTFLADWLTIYSQLVMDAPTSPLPPPNWEAFRQRGRTSPVSREVRRSVRPPGLLYDTYRFFYRPTVRLPGVPFDETDEPAPLSGLYSVSVGDDAMQRIRHESRKLSVSVNDWLLAAMYVALAEWTEIHRPEPPHKMLRITIPYSLRTEETLNSPASNQIGYEILSHRMDDSKTFADLSREIARFTGPVRALRTSTFTKLLRTTRFSGWCVPFIAQNWAKCFATVIFSNVGDVSRLFHPVVGEKDGRWTFGNLVVDRIACAPPTRPQSHFALVVMRYAGRLHFSTRCEGRELAPSSIRAFLDHYRATVLDLTGIEEKTEVLSSTDQRATTIADSA